MGVCVPKSLDCGSSGQGVGANICTKYQGSNLQLLWNLQLLRNLQLLWNLLLCNLDLVTWKVIKTCVSQPQPSTGLMWTKLYNIHYIRYNV